MSHAISSHDISNLIHRTMVMKGNRNYCFCLFGLNVSELGVTEMLSKFFFPKTLVTTAADDPKSQDLRDIPKTAV